MKLFKQIGDCFLIFRRDAAFIAENRGYIARQNRGILKNMSVFYLAVLLVYLAASLLWLGEPLPSVTLVIAVAAQLLFIVWVRVRGTNPRDDYNAVLVDCIIFASLIQAAIILLSIFAQPDQPGVLFYPMLICMSLFYTLPFVVTLTLVTGYATLFLIFSVVFKPTGVFLLDLIGTVTAWVLAIISCYVTLSLRISDAAARNRLIVMSSTDPMTRLRDKVSMQLLCEEFLSDRGNISSCAFMIFDVDNFKEINDTLGHRVGDEMLVEFTALLRRVFGDIRPEALLGRFGGDEFVALIKNSVGKLQVCALCEELCRITHEELSARFSVPVSCSIGVALFDDSPSSYDEMFDCADRALYTAKAGGKNRVAFYSEPTDSGGEQTDSNPSPVSPDNTKSE